ncbi:hypothetical protein GCM10025859_45670 [Alicyclobacillus fastidiosus]|nr:hypothetical protein GCM10025859_45670 [Alicyclobacillus fastidiosus]
MNTMEKQIDQYVNEVYSGLVETKEVHDLKEEMRNHLLQTARDLKQQGHNEEESVRLAIERFGDGENLRHDLETLYGPTVNQVDSSRAGNVLGWASLIVGLLSFLSSVYAILSIPLGIVGLILGVIARKGSNRRIAIWGIAVSAVAILLTIFLLLLLTVHSYSVTPVNVHSSSQPMQTNHS